MFRRIELPNTIEFVFGSVIWLSTIAGIFLIENVNAILLLFVPLVFFIIFIYIARSYKYFEFPGMFVFNIICLVRYVVIPILILLDRNYIDNGMLYEGIKLMLYEELVVGFFLVYITQNHYKKLKKKSKEGKRLTNINTEVGFAFKIIAVCGVLITLTNPSSLNQYNILFFSDTVNVFEYGKYVSGISGTVLNLSKFTVPLVLISYLARKNCEKQNALYYYVALIIIISFNLFIFKGVSRNSVVLPGVASLFFIARIFPDRRKQTFLIFSLAIFVVVFMLTVIKNSYLGANSAFSLSGFTRYLESYFVGPRQLGYALQANRVMNDSFSVKTLLNDIFANAPGLSRWFDLNERTTTYYNMVIYNWGKSRDAIIPTIGQGLFYFGYVFSIIPELIFIRLMLVFDKKYFESNDIESVFFLAYFAVRFGNNFVQNVSILFGFVFSLIIPVSLLLWLNNNVKIKSKNKVTRKYEGGNRDEKDSFCSQ